jgi:hypothetical protein
MPLTRFFFILAFVLAFIPSRVALANIDATNAYAWGENIGWINFGTVQGAVVVSDTTMEGYAWGENIGWISLNCSNTNSCTGGPTTPNVNYGVVISNGVLSGYVWGENIGWISLNCSNTNSCTGGATTPNVDYGVTLDVGTGIFSGYAWGENIGWIVFNCATTNSCATVDYKLQTNAILVPPTPTPGVGACVGPGCSNPPGFSPSPTPTPTPTFSPTPVPSPTSTPTLTPVPPVSPTPISIVVLPPTLQPTVIVPAEPTPFPVPPPPPSEIPDTAPPFVIPSSPPPSIGATEPTPPSSPSIVERADEVLNEVAETIMSPRSVAGAATVVTGIALIPALATTAGAVAQGEVAALAFQMFQIIGIRKRAKVWGVVYDAATKRPIPLAKIELLDTANRILETRYADRDGRYGFLLTPAALNTGELSVQMRVTKSGYQFPSAHQSTGTDFIVYDNLYFGGTIIMQNTTLLNYNIPLDPKETTRYEGWSMGSTLRSLGARALSLGFYIGVIAVPLNWWLAPSGKNLVIGIIFFSANAARILAARRAYGVTTDVFSSNRMPYALVTLNDLEGNRQGFAVSDEQGRFILSGEADKDYELVAYTPAHVVPQRSIRRRVRGIQRWTTQAWITENITL